jgi:hypothetical protein
MKHRDGDRIKHKATKTRKSRRDASGGKRTPPIAKSRKVLSTIQQTIFMMRLQITIFRARYIESIDTS